ncbi:MAG: Holliday junction branch migration protein RuvA [Desulfovibrio sp.]|nr:Holliday junction branch migration protein RuvA [Desulfovibrio sp.]
MIAYLEGRLLESTESSCVILTPGGVGYRIGISTATREALPKKGENLSLYTTLIVREDALELYGFTERDERETFDLLLSISKVGARTALAVLSVFSPKALQQVVVDGDPLLLTQVPGIGKKTAQYVFLELKDKLKFLDGLEGAAAGGTGEVMRSVLDGLTGLGYNEQETYPVVSGLLKAEPDLDVPAALREALKVLSREKK